jgi:hypothetical protein
MTNSGVDAPATGGGAAPGARSTALGGSVLVFLAAAYVAATAGYAIGLALGWWIVLPAVAVQAGYLVRAGHGLEPVGRRRLVLVALGGTAVLLVGAGLVARSLPDNSIDGTHYHSASIRTLAAGYNPLRDAALPDTAVDPAEATNSYPKAAWILEATVSEITGAFGTGKLLTFVTLLAAGAIAFGSLVGAGLSRAAAAWLSFALSLSPVVTTELWTHMVDGVMSALLLAAVLLAVRWAPGRGDRHIVVPPLLATVVLLVGTKQSALVFLPLIVGGVIVAGGLARGSSVWRPLGVLALAGLFGIAVVGYNPYVTNTLRYGNPLNAVFGGDKAAGENYRTGAFASGSGPQLLAKSLFAPTRGGDADRVPVKIPFTFASSEWNEFRYPGLRMGGFGPLFSGVLVLAGAAVVALIVRRRRYPIGVDAQLLLAAAGCCVLAAVVVPTSFVARFAPELWFVPGFVFAATLLTVPTGWWRRVALVGVALLVVNAAGIGASAVRWQILDGRRQNENLAKLAEVARVTGRYDAEFTLWRQPTRARLREAGVDFRTVDRVRCETPVALRPDGTLAFAAVDDPPSGSVLFCAPGPPAP